MSTIFENEQRAFRDRIEAGERLAARLARYANRHDVIVLGIPRGGIPVAFQVAKALHVPLDIFLSRKLGVPGQEELAFGAIASGGIRVLDREVIESVAISGAEIERIAAEVKHELDRREKLYRGGRPPLNLRGRTVLLIDDGIATGSSMRAAIDAIRQLQPARLVVAVPVAPRRTCELLERAVDELVAVLMPENFYAIGQFYEDFSQTSDEEVADLLRQAAEPAARSDVHEQRGSLPEEGSEREASIALEDAKLGGTLALPKDALGLVLFAHGSGSSRHSPRNRRVAQALQSRGIATLLFDLLTRREETADEESGEFRFNIPLLTRRLVGATRWVLGRPDTKNLPIGYFGASTGAAAALRAAAELPSAISAVVSRGGRPDLAEEALATVHVPTLLIVGGNDEPVITMNRQALEKLPGHESKLVIVPGATHLFPEPGALEEVSRLAGEWFDRHFAAKARPAARSAHAVKNS